MSKKILRFYCIFVFCSALLSNRANAVLINNYLPSASTIVSSAAESVYPAILPTLFAQGLLQNSRLPEFTGGVITDPLDISGPSENILPGNGVLSLHIEEPGGHPLAVAVSKQSGHKIHILSERRGEVSPDTHDRIFLLPGTGQPAQILEVTAEELEVYEVPEDYDHLLNDMMPKPPGLVMVYRNREGEWIITVSDPEGTREISLDEYRQGMSLLFESLLSLEFGELPVSTLGLDTGGARTVSPGQGKKTGKTTSKEPAPSGSPPEPEAGTISSGFSKSEGTSAAAITEGQPVDPVEVCRHFKELDQLHHFVSPAELAMLTTVANDSHRREKLEQLKTEGLNSELYGCEDTCNTLYWGLMNNELTERQFLENYHFLTLRLAFPLLKGGAGLKLSPDDYLEMLLTLPENKATIEHFFGGLPVLYISHPESPTWENLDSVHYSIISRRGNYAQNEGCDGLEAWIYDFREFFPRCRISSVSNIKRAWESCSPDHKPLAMKPGFGFGDWNALKQFRLQEQHPVALWHPQLNSLTYPDGRWINTLAHLHDFMHLKGLSTLPQALRNEALTLDSLAIEPAITLLEHLADQQLTGDEKQFLAWNDQQVEFLSKWNPHLVKWSALTGEAISEHLKKLKDDRYLVDMNFVKEDYHPVTESRFYSRFTLHDTGAINQLLQNLFIFNLVNGNDRAFAERFLKVELKEYEEARTTIEALHSQSLEPSWKYTGVPKEVIKKWFIDWWVRKPRLHRYTNSAF